MTPGPDDRLPDLDDANVDGSEPSDESEAVPTAVEEAARDELATPADETDEG